MSKITRPRGTQDVLPDESWKWNALEPAFRSLAGRFGYGEIRLPTFESTELFSRSVGEGTDIVTKEMYTFTDKGNRSVTLRPEGTAGIVRAVLENGLLAASPLPLKYYYLQSCFRYEKAQKGRYREFHQFGIECFGTHEPAADAEVMAVMDSLLKEYELAPFVSLEINSIGHPACRATYNAALRQYFERQKEQLCPTCTQRLQTNPMRILDCKEARCQAVAKNAPVMLDYLCDDCAEHFEQVKTILAEMEIDYVVNPRIVRGLDYYTNTVFEFVAEGVGTQGTVCAGGRYDGLVEELGGQSTPGVGFAMGIERFLLLLEETGRQPKEPAGPLVYLAAADEAGRSFARKLTAQLRQRGIGAECDIAARSVKAQMKHANRLKARFVAVAGQRETDAGALTFKNMADGEEVACALGEDAAGAVELLLTEQQLAE